MTLLDDLRRLFRDEDAGGFFQTGSDAATLLVRPKELYDNATPSGNSVAAEALVRMAALTGDHELFDDEAESSPADRQGLDGPCARALRARPRRARPRDRPAPRGGDRRGSRRRRHPGPGGRGHGAPVPAEPRARRRGPATTRRLGEPCRCSRSIRRSAVRRPPTSARASRAGCRSPTPKALRAQLDDAHRRPEPAWGLGRTSSLARVLAPAHTGAVGRPLATGGREWPGRGREGEGMTAGGPRKRGRMP